MDQEDVFNLVVMVLVLVVLIPLLIVLNIARRRRLRRAGQPVPQLLTMAPILLAVAAPLVALGIAVTLIKH